MPTPEPLRSPIAVVGLSALFPGSTDESGFWRDILAGRDLIRDVPPTHWLREDYFDADPKAPDKTYATRGAFLDPVPFDALGFGVPPSIVPATDTSQLLALIVAQRVLDEAARGQFANLPRERISVILGVTSGQELLSSMVSRLQRPVWVKSLREAGLPESKVQEVCDRIAAHYVPWQESTFPGLLGNVVAGRIANRFDTGGTNCVTDAACASSFSAVSMGVNELALGQSDLVITGGVDTLNDIFMYMCFAKTHALSPTGDCRPFSDEADGTLLGEGLAMLALKRLEDAEAAGDRIYAVLRGVGSSSDGRAKSVYAPRPEGQARAVARAYEAAGYGPETVELVEAHGTGTKAGDVAEAEGLRLAFDASGRADRQWCALGSVKSQMGHAKAAAGAAGLFKIVMSLLHGALPPTIKVARPNPKLELEKSPFYLNTCARPWVRGSDHPRRAAVSSFGFGGSNFHLTVEEYCGPRPRPLRKRTASAELLTFGAATPQQLLTELRELDLSGEGFLRSLARRSLESCPQDAAARIGIVAADEADLRRKIDGALKAIAEAPDKPCSLPGVHYQYGVTYGEVALLFPGQGSQRVGMGAGLALGWREALEAWDLAADLVGDGPERLHHVVFPRPAFTEEERAAQAARLKRTEWAQPALGAASLAQLRLLSKVGLVPDFVAGHSFGEIMALHAAGAIDAAAALRVARRRGELMAEAARTPGAMTAVLAPVEQVREALAQAPGATLANLNAPLQSVVSGTVDAVERAEAAFRERGLRFERLEVATAFHSEVVAASQRPFESFLGEVELCAPRIPVYSNVEAAPYPSDPAAMRQLLASQLAKPVRFVELIESMYAAGARTFVEVGPGSVLTGLVERILAGRPGFQAIALDVKGKDAVAAFHEGLARLWAAGHAVDFAALWAEVERPTDPRKAKAPAVSLSLCGANHGKPYPPPEGVAGLPPPNPELPAAQSTAGGGTATGPLADGWLETYQQAQRETLEAHAAWQRAMTETHTAFLKAAERSFEALGAVGADPGALATLVQATTVQPAPAAPQATKEPRPIAEPGSNQAQSIPGGAPRAEPAPSQALQSILLEVVAAKTGYPAEMLNLDLGLESDLGIDSIKRVEILSALRERVPELPEVEPAAMASHKTLGAIVRYVEERRGPLSAPIPTQPRESSGPQVGHPQPQDLKALLLEVVAAKTGYPAEMLNLDLGLESDLGIDSIKRVEILSGLRERVLDLPEIEPAAMASLKTLGAIVRYIEERQAAGAPSKQTELKQTDGAVAPRSTPAADQKPSAHDVDLNPVLSPLLQADFLPRQLLLAMERAAPGLGLAGLSRAQHLVVIDDGAGVAPALASYLSQRGISAGVASEVPEGADAVILLGGLAPALDPDSAKAQVLRSFHAARRVARQFAESGGIWVSVQDTGGDFGLSGNERAWLAGLAGIAKTAAAEWPKASVKVLDVEQHGRPPEEVAQAIATELFEGGNEREVGLRADGRRVVLRLAPSVADQFPVKLAEGSVIVATGGARGVTAACLIELARQMHGRFVLLGRTEVADEPQACRGVEGDANIKRALLEDARAHGRKLLPADLVRDSRAILASREIRSTLEAIRGVGGEARYLPVDVCDRSTLEAVLDGVRRKWGPISAVVHGAGVLADKRIEDKTDAAFERVYDTKVLGLRSLLEATACDPLEAICLFSSVAARCGNEGQCDYAAANEVLNKVAALEAKRRGPSCRVKSIGWGPWDGGMVDSGLRARFTALGAKLIGLDAGARAFVDELTRGGTVTEVLLGAEIPAREKPIISFYVHVDQHSNPQLADHRIEDVPVLPVVQALEWFARAAKASAPDLELSACRDVRVLRGIRLDRLFERGHWFTITCRFEASDRLRLELVDLAGGVRFAAMGDLAAKVARSGPPPSLPSLTGPLPHEIYGRVLFHGPQFQVVRNVEGVSAEGLVGTVVGTRERGWQGEWLTDAAALDGGLQLALLWSGHMTGGQALPTSIGSLKTYRAGAGEGPLRCILHGRVIGDSKTTSDIAFVAQDGMLVCEMEGVDTHRRPEPQGSRS